MTGEYYSKAELRRIARVLQKIANTYCDSQGRTRNGPRELCTKKELALVIQLCDAELWERFRIDATDVVRPHFASNSTGAPRLFAPEV